MKEIEESGMKFSVNVANSFLIEKSDFVQGLGGMSKCEFISINDKEVRFVEAKTTFSNPNNNKGNFDENIREVVSKFDGSIQILHGILVRHPNERKIYGIPDSMASMDQSDIRYVLYLVIKNHKDEWVLNVSNELKSKLKTICKLWRIQDSDIKVFNENFARQKGLIK